MSTATGTVTAPSLRRLPFTVFLAPELVNALKKQLPEEETPAISGWLLGVNDNTTIHVRQAYPCALNAGNAGALTGSVAATEAQSVAESKGLSVVGWYALRSTTGLQAADIEFHSQQFPRPGDLAVIVRPESPTEAVFELYSRSVDGLLTEDEFRWGLLPLPNEAQLTQSAEVTMRSPMRDDFFLRAYDQTDEPGKVNKAIAGFLPAAANASRRLGVWLAVVLTFGLAAAIVFLVVRYETVPAGQNAPANSNSPLGLRLQAEGERILVTWNRNLAIAQSVKAGRLFIEDGDLRRTLTLDNRQVANGSVLYTPNSAQVAFRLEVTNANGKTTDETLRVLDASKDNSGGVKPLQLQPVPVKASPQRAHAPTANRKSPDIKQPPPISQSPAAALADSRPAAAAPPPSMAPDENEMARQSGSSGAVASAPITKQEETTSPMTQKPPERTQAITTPPKTAVADAPKKTEPALNTASEPRVAQPKIPPPQERPLTVAPPPVTAPTNLCPSNYRAPQPARQVMPDTHFLAAGIMANGGRVEVTVKIDDRGQVTEAQLNNPRQKISSALVSAALSAARQWKFEPATMNGKVITSEHTIVFVFNPAKR